MSRARPEELVAFLTRIRNGRQDRYSDERAQLLASGEPRPKVEMSYLSGSSQWINCATTGTGVQR